MSRKLDLGRALRASALAAVVLAGAGCARAPEPPARPWNLLVVLVDTLRADRLSLYGYERETSPALDRFARERGVVFRRAWANAGCTFPSASSILTGRWPQHFLARTKTYGMAIPPDTPSLAERLAARGYATAAVSSSIIVRKTPSKINRQGGFDRGFASFDESCESAAASCVNARAFERLAGLPEPFFLYLHYLEPHHPYRPPRHHEPSFVRRNAPGARRWAANGDPERVFRRLYDGDASIELDRTDLARLSDLYDEEIRYFDGRFAELVGELERRELLERTVVVFLSDHGEELYDHEAWGHCRDLAYETLLATPLVLWVPGLPAGERTSLVSNLDLAPTLLDLLGVPVGPGELDGRSLRSVLEGGDAAAGTEGLLFAVQGRSRSARDVRRQLLLDLGSGALRSFAEAGPLARLREEARPDGAEVAPLRAALDGWIAAVEPGLDRAAAVEQAEALERDLRALGYL
jgi:arylsulfatase A-like enzyme